jgi:hypothetical protein
MAWMRRVRRTVPYAAETTLKAQQQALANAQRAWGLPASQEPRGPDFAPIAGVSVQHYADICRDIHTTPDGDIKMAAIAERHGVARDAWRQAFDGWNARCLTNVAVAQAYTDAYQGR